MAAPIIVQGLLADGSQGGAFGARKTDVVGVSTSVAIPAGVWMVETDAHVTVRHNTDANPAGTFATWVPVSAAALIVSDGYSVEWRGDGTGGNGIRTLVRPISPQYTAS